MNHRIFLGRLLIRLGGFIRSLALMVMRPDDLIEFSRQTYALSKSIKSWSRKEILDAGLNQDEIELLKKLPLKQGRLLVLGVGSGREAMPLAQIGFDVTGLDFVPEMLEMAKENARKHGLKIDGIIREISKLDIPRATYDVIWLSASMYSCIPTRKRRVEMLERINSGLRPGGYFLCQFQLQTEVGQPHKAEFLKRVFALLTLGNFWYEKGDVLWANVEFIHAFSSADEVRSEFERGGFEIISMHTPDGSTRGGAVMKKI